MHSEGGGKCSITFELLVAVLLQRLPVYCNISKTVKLRVAILTPRVTIPFAEDVINVMMVM